MRIRHLDTNLSWLFRISGLRVTNDWTLYPAADYNKPTLSTAPLPPSPQTSCGSRIEMKMKLKILINFYPRCPTVSWVKLLLINSFCDTINVNMLTYKRGKGNLKIARWLKPRSLACISVMMMTVPSVWNLIKDSSYLYWHSLPASDWSRPCPACLPLAGGWHLCAPIVWLRVAQSWIKLWLAGWPGHPRILFTILFSSLSRTPGPGPAGHQATSLDTHSSRLLWMMFGLFDICYACSSHLSVSSPCHIWFPQLTNVTCQPQPTIPVKSAILKQKRWQKRLFLQSSHCLFWRKVTL